MVFGYKSRSVPCTLVSRCLTNFQIHTAQTLYYHTTSQMAVPVWLTTYIEEGDHIIIRVCDKLYYNLL